jgi:hypothetical protein
MRIRTTALILAGTLVALSACRTVGTPGGSNFYDCNQGTRLVVDYVGATAIVKVNNRGRIVLKQTPSVNGSVYEGRKGQRLERTGGGVIWNTALRMAPETCRSVIVPR